VVEVEDIEEQQEERSTIDLQTDLGSIGPVKHIQSTNVQPAHHLKREKEEEGEMRNEGETGRGLRTLEASSMSLTCRSVTG